MAYSYDRSKKAIDFSTPDALKTYLREHPQADTRKHRVIKKKEDKGPSRATVPPNKDMVSEIDKAVGNKPGPLQTLKRYINKGLDVPLSKINLAINVLEHDIKDDDDIPAAEKKKYKELVTKLKSMART